MAAAFTSSFLGAGASQTAEQKFDRRKATLRSNRAKGVISTSDAIIVALIGVAGSGIGAFGGVLISAKLTQYRLEQLEKKVETHNNLIDRVYKLEEHNEIQDEKIRVANHRIDDLEKKGGCKKCGE